MFKIQDVIAVSGCSLSSAQTNDIISDCLKQFEDQENCYIYLSYEMTF